MNNSELDKILKASAIPDRELEVWERLPKRITAKLHRQSRTAPSPLDQSFQFARLAWMLGGAAACVAIAFVVFVSRNPTRNSSSNAVAQAEKCFREIEALFPNQVQAIVFDDGGPRMVLAEKADVPKSPPLYLKICGPVGCQGVVTFSGQQIRVNGDYWDVLVDSAGHVLLVGKQLVWSSGSPGGRTGSYRIEAHPLETSS